VDVKQLDAELPISGGAVSINASVGGGLLQSFLDAATSGQPLTIASARKTIGADSITIEGHAPLLTLGGAPIVAAFKIASGAVTVTLTWQPVTVPLSMIFSRLAPALPPPPDLTISSLAVTIVPSKSYSLSAGASPWTLDIGPTSMTISGVSLTVSDAGGHASGSIKGTLDLGGGVTVPATYKTPGTFSIHAEVPSISLTHLISRLDAIGVTLPHGFDLTLTDTFLDIEKDGSLTFSAATKVNNAMLLELEAVKDGSWGFAAGVQIGNGNPSSMPGFGPLAAIESFVGLGEVLLVLSSLTKPNFTFPGLAHFDTPTLSGSPLQLPSQASGVVRGVNVYAQLSAAKNAGLQLISRFLHVRLDGTLGITLSISAPDPATNSKLFFVVGTNINSATHLDGKLGVLLLNNAAGAFLEAKVQTSIQGHALTFDVSAIFVPTGFLISGTMVGSVHFSPVTLTNLAIEIGVDEALIPSFGFAATIDVSTFESSIAIFFDSTNPSNSMFAGAIDGVTLLTIAESIAGQSNVPSPLASALGQFGIKGISAFATDAGLAAALDNRNLAAVRAAFASHSVTLPSSDDQIFLMVNRKGSVWHLTDLSTMLHYKLATSGNAINVELQPQIYCAPQATQIGTLHYPQGVHVIGELDEYLIKARIKAEVSTSQGIAIDAGIAPITILSANFFSIRGNGPDGGPFLSLATFTQSSESDPNLRPPHFLLTGSIHLLGIDAAGTYVSISSDGFVFQVNETSGVTRFQLNGSVTHSGQVAVNGAVTIGFDRSFNAGPLGSIHVVATVNGTLGVSGGPSGASASVSGGFNFMGLSLSIPSISLDVSGAALANLGETVWSHLVDILKNVLLDPNQWLNWVKNKIVSGAAETAQKVGQVLSGVYHLAGDQIAQKTRDILGYTSTGVAAALQGAGYAAQQAAQFMMNAGYTVADTAKAIGGVFTGATHVDFSIGHVDVPQGPHADSPSAPHVDWGAKHSDWGTHGDSGSGFFHWDTSLGHFDHTVTPHLDTAAYPHIDTHTTPHGDTGTHVDT
jgi:hypothetical protein